MSLLTSDRTSKLHIRANQILDITRSITDIQCSVHIYAGAVAYTPAEVYVDNTTFTWRGELVGVSNLTIQNSGSLVYNNIISFDNLRLTKNAIAAAV